MGIRLKDLSKLGYRDNVARSLAVALVNKYCKHETKERILAILGDVLGNPEIYKKSEAKRLGRQYSFATPWLTKRHATIRLMRF